jgi:hypothetical protein
MIFWKGGRTMQKHWRITYFVMCMVMLLSSAGCAGSLFKNYGTIIPDRAARNAFEKYQINPNFTYYISGSDVYPNAIIGVDKAYTLESDLWKKVEMTPPIFRELVMDMQTRALNLGQSQHGFAMFDDKGNRIGIWYSILSARMMLKMKDSRTVIIYTPDIDTYEKYERGGNDHSK